MWDLLREPRAVHKVEVLTEVLENDFAALLQESLVENDI